MSSRQDRLSNWQLIILISSAIIGVAVLKLPRVATEKVLADGALATLVAGLLAMALQTVIVKLSSLFPNETVMEYSSRIVGKLLGKLFGFLIVIYFALTSGVILRFFSDALKILLLERTPLEVIMISLLIVVVYLIQNGISSIAKICESFQHLVVISFLLVILLNYQNFDPVNLRPMLSRGFLPTIKSLPDLFLVYLGFEVVYFFIPFMNDQKKILSFSLLGLVVPIFLYTALVAVSIGVFGARPTSKLMYPTVNLAKVISFPGAFAERFDILFMILWILGAYTSLSIYYYLAAFSSAHLLGLKNYRPFIFLLMPFIYIIAILPQNIFQIEALTGYASYLGMAVVAFAVPLLLIAMIMKKGGKSNV